MLFWQKLGKLLLLWLKNILVDVVHHFVNDKVRLKLLFLLKVIILNSHIKPKYLTFRNKARRLGQIHSSVNPGTEKPLLLPLHYKYCSCLICNFRIFLFIFLLYHSLMP